MKQSQDFTINTDVQYGKSSTEIMEARAVRYTSEQIQKSVDEWLKHKSNKIVQCGCYWENES